MRVVMLGNKLTLVSGHSRPVWQTARRLCGQGHEVRMVVSTMDARTGARLAFLARKDPPPSPDRPK